MTALHPGEDTGEGSGNGGGVAVVGGIYGFICLNSGGGGGLSFLQGTI